MLRFYITVEIRKIVFNLWRVRRTFWHPWSGCSTWLSQYFYQDRLPDIWVMKSIVTLKFCSLKVLKAPIWFYINPWWVTCIAWCLLISHCKWVPEDQLWHVISLKGPDLWVWHDWTILFCPTLFGFQHPAGVLHAVPEGIQCIWI